MNKNSAYLLMSAAFSSIILGTLVIYYFFLPESPIQAVVWSVFLTVLLHLPQVPKSMKIAEGKNLSRSRVIIKTVIFGASWWKPLEMGLIDK